jgi:hypothetical protein
MVNFSTSKTTGSLKSSAATMTAWLRSIFSPVSQLSFARESGS